MRVLISAAVAATLVGCASTESTQEFEAALRDARSHSTAPVRVEATDEATKTKLQPCLTQFHGAFTDLVNGPSLPFSVVTERADELDRQFAGCSAALGSTSRPVFSVDGQYIYPADFVRSWQRASNRLANAQAWQAQSRSIDTLGWAAGLAGAARTLPPASAPARSVNCTSRPSPGGAVYTTCY